MYTINRYLKTPLQRSAQLFLHRNQRVLNNPLIQQTIQYSKFKDNDGEDQCSKKSKSDIKKTLDDDDKGGYTKMELKKSETENSDIKKLKGPKIEMRIIPATYSRMDYDEKNMKLGRELSPHLSIYRKQLTSVMSILLRFSGCALAIGVWIIGISGYNDISIDAMAEKIEKCDCSGAIFNLLKFCIVLPFAYHICAGTRHLIWYLNVFLSKPEIYATGYVAIALTFLVAAGLAMISPEKDENRLSKVDYDGQIEMNITNLVDDKTEQIEMEELHEDDENVKPY